IVGRVGREGAAIVEMALDRVALDGHVGDLAALDLAEEIGEGKLRVRTATRRALEEVEQEHQQNADDDPQGQVLAEIVHVGRPLETKFWRRSRATGKRTMRASVRALTSGTPYRAR